MEVIEFLYLNGFSITKRKCTAENQGKIEKKAAIDASNGTVEQSNTKTKTV